MHLMSTGKPGVMKDRESLRSLQADALQCFATATYLGKDLTSLVSGLQSYSGPPSHLDYTFNRLDALCALIREKIELLSSTMQAMRRAPGLASLATTESGPSKESAVERTIDLEQYLEQGSAPGASGPAREGCQCAFCVDFNSRLPKDRYRKKKES